MSKRDPRVDDYIAKAADFAQPILKHIRTVIHQGCPQVEETIKWGFPHFMYKGVLCNMASFRAHCAFGFWKGDLLFRGNNSVQKKAAEAMGHFGRITTLADLPSKDTLLSYIKEAARLNEEGVKRPTKPKSK